MREREEFLTAKRTIEQAHRSGAPLCGPFVAAFPISGAAISVLAGPRSQSTICASDGVAERLDELQFDLGEGPCWAALASHSPVLRPDIRRTGQEWPAFTDAVLADSATSEVSAMFAFPLVVGSLDIGAVDLYATDARPLDAPMVAEVTALADLAAWQVLRRILDDHAGPYDSASLGYARREIHQATGMVLVQLDIDAQDAELLLRAHAFATGRTVAEIANDVVERRLVFSPGDHRARE